MSQGQEGQEEQGPQEIRVKREREARGVPDLTPVVTQE